MVADRSSAFVVCTDVSKWAPPPSAQHEVLAVAQVTRAEYRLKHEWVPSTFARSSHRVQLLSVHTDTHADARDDPVGEYGVLVGHVVQATVPAPVAKVPSKHDVHVGELGVVHPDELYDPGGHWTVTLAENPARAASVSPLEVNLNNTVGPPTTEAPA